MYLVDDSSPASSPTGLVIDGWIAAFQDPQDALDQAVSGDIILIAEGNYTPDTSNLSSRVSSDYSGQTPDDRYYSFIAKVPVTMIGGFKGYSTAGSGTILPGSPDGDPTLTILDGDVFNTPADIRDNSHHVVHIDGSLHADFAVNKVKIERLVVRLGYAFPAHTPASSGVNKGAGIFCEDAFVDLDEVTVTTCWAEGDGGGIYVKNGSLRTKTTVVSNNLSLDNGGGICINGQQAVSPQTALGWRFLTQIHNTLILDNVAVADANSVSGAGGGLYFVGPFHDWGAHPGISVANCLIKGNRAKTGGGAFVYMGNLGLTSQSDYSNEWINCTFANNESNGDPSVYAINGKGGGLMVGLESTLAATVSNFHMHNCILKSNTGRETTSPVAANFGLINLFGGTTISLATGSVTHCDIGPSPIVTAIPSTLNWAGTLLDVIDLDPKFMNTTLGDYHLQANSPCRDVGNDTRLSFDYRDLDEDGATWTERIPLDLDRYYGGTAPGNLRPREWTPVIPKTTSGILGVDGGNTTGHIADLGCYEWQPLFQNP